MYSTHTKLTFQLSEISLRGYRTNDFGPQFFTYSSIVSSGNITQINDNTSGYVAGGLGQHVTGTFLADSNTQTITFSGASFAPVLNAFQLRTVAVPEPVAGVLVIGIGMILLRRRRQVAASDG